MYHVNVPCTLQSIDEMNSSEDNLQNILLTVAVSDELNHEDMLLSDDDYRTLLEHRNTIVPRAKVR